MSKGIKILVALLALSVLVGGYFAVSRFMDREEAETGDETEKITVKTFDAGDVTGIKYVYGDETIELVKKNDKWQLSSDSEFPVNQTYPATMVTETAGLTAKRLISETSDLFSEYGLSEPSEAFFFTRSDGSTVTVFIGDYNSFSDAYYINVSGTEEVYLVEGSYLDNFHYGLAKLADVEDLPTITSGDVKGIKVKTENKNYELKYYEKAPDTVYTSIYNWFMSGGIPLETTSVSGLISTVTGFKSAGCGDYRATNEELKKYGFSEPNAVIEIAYTTTETKETGELDDEGNEISEEITTEHVLKLTVGGFATEGVDYYAKLSDSDVIYLIEKSYVDSLDNADIDALRPMDVCMVDMDSVDSLDVTFGGKTRTITVTRTKDEKGNASVAYRMDGKTITASDYDGFFSSIQSMRAESVTDKSTGSEPYLTVVYNRNTEKFKTVTLKFIPFDSSFYLVELDGERRLLVNKYDVEEAVKAFNSIKLH